MSESESENEKQQLEAALQCAVCRQTYVEPITQPCGHSFCRACILQSLAAGARQCCAICNKPSLDLETVLASNETFALRELLIQLHGGEAAYAELIRQNKIANSGLAIKLWERLQTRDPFQVHFNVPPLNAGPMVYLDQQPTPKRRVPWIFIGAAGALCLVTAGIWLLPLKEASKAQLTVAAVTCSALGYYATFLNRIL